MKEEQEEGRNESWRGVIYLRRDYHVPLGSHLTLCGEACGIVRSHGSVVKKRSRSRGVKIYTPAINLQKGSPTPDFLYHADTTLSAHGQYVQLTLTNQTLKKYDNIPHSAALQGGGMDAQQQTWEYFSEKGGTGCRGRNKQPVYPQDRWWHHYLPITASPTIWMETLPTAQNNCSLWGTVRLHGFQKTSM